MHDSPVLVFAFKVSPCILTLKQINIYDTSWLSIFYTFFYRVSEVRMYPPTDGTWKFPLAAAFLFRYL